MFITLRKYHYNETVDINPDMIISLHNYSNGGTKIYLLGGYEYHHVNIEVKETRDEIKQLIKDECNRMDEAEVEFLRKFGLEVK